MTELPKSARRVEQAVSALGLSARIVCHAVSSRTAEDAAAACGCDVGQIIKSMIFQGKQSKTAYLILVSGKNRVNEKAAAKVLGEPLVRPDASFVREVTGFAIGGVAPIGHLNPPRVFFDPRLQDFDLIYAAAGTPRNIFPIAPVDLLRISGAQVFDFTS